MSEESKTQIIAPYYDLFSAPIEDMSTTRFEYVEYRTDNATLTNTNRNYDINHKDLDAWILPADSYIQVTGRVEKAADQTAYAATDKVGLVNNGYNVFERAQYAVDGQNLETLEYVGHTTTIQNLVEFSDDYKRSVGTNMLWYPDTNSGAAQSAKEKYGLIADATAPVDAWIAGKTYIGGNENYNLGFAERHAVVNGAGSHKQVNLFLPLKHLFGFCKIPRVYRGMRHTLRLTRSSMENMIHRVGASAADFTISKVSWWVPIVSPSLLVQARLESKLAAGATMRLNWEATTTHRSNAMGSSDSIYRVTTTSQKISRVFVAFQLVSKEGDQTENNMIFDNKGVSNLHIRVNSTHFSNR